MIDSKGLKANVTTPERRHRSSGAETPAGLHDWRGHTREAIEWQVYRGDATTVLRGFEANSFDCVVTSPPYYWQRDYKVAGQIGLEKTIDGFVQNIVETMEQVRRVLAANGLLFLNLGDTYYSAKGQPKGTDKKSAARRFGLRAVDTSGLGVPRKTIIGMFNCVGTRMIRNPMAAISAYASIRVVECWSDIAPVTMGAPLGRGFFSHRW